MTRSTLAIRLSSRRASAVRNASRAEIAGPFFVTGECSRLPTPPKNVWLPLSERNAPDGAIEAIDDAVGRLLVDHKSAWARQGRVAGEYGEAWIIGLRTPAAAIALYWDYYEENLILLAAVIARSA